MWGALTPRSFGATDLLVKAMTECSSFPAPSAVRSARGTYECSEGSTVSDPADLTLLEGSALLRTRRLSAVELLAACQRRIERRNGGQPSFDGAPDAVNAWARLYPEVAEGLARAADRRLDRERLGAPLVCGMPLALKDLFAVAGLPLTASSQLLAEHIAEDDCVVWKRLHDAGMVLVGHTHTHEFAAGARTDQVGNPWALNRSAGGSSGGSAAALASCMVPAATGTDTAGSLRIPAALCGVSTIKPTHGRVPIDGIIPLALTLDHAGPMARTVADASALLAVLVHAGGQITPLGAPPAPIPTLPLAPRASTKPLAGITIALTDRPEAKGGLDPDVAGALERARNACADLGAHVIELPAVPDLPATYTSTIKFSEVWAYHRHHAASAARYRTTIRKFVETGRDSASAADYIDAQLRRERMTAEWEQWFASHQIDFLLEPTVPIIAPPRGEGYDARGLGTEGDQLIRLTSTWNATGFPVVALPAGQGERSGLPIGISLIAVRGAEAPLIQAAIDIQANALPPAKPPTLDVGSTPGDPRPEERG
jgi:aspartyl-tRNA(Asn)/glutamyl-tRNA(Gln) amidotransferase subunit A